MKKFLLIVTIAFTVVSCAKDEECVCDNGVTLTESDAKDSNSTLAESCSLAEVGGAKCSIK